MKTRDWTAANKRLLEWEAAEKIEKNDAPISLADAWAGMITDLEARRLSHGTVTKYRLLKTQMTEFATARGLSIVSDFNVDNLGRFRATWKDGARTAAKKLERLRSFFRFAHDRAWVTSNPAKMLKAPKAKPLPTLPFSRDEMVKLIAGCDAYSATAPKSARLNARRLKALILLMRYSGLRIGDAVSLTHDRIEASRLFLYTQKSGTAVYTVLPDFVLKVLGETPSVTPTRYFWSGEGKIESIVRSWQTRMRRLLTTANVPKGSGNMLSHRFRDTFSVELLLAGVPLERVSILLGHSSLRITEKHYAPWIKSRQEQLEADVARAWSGDTLLEKIAGTNQVQFSGRRYN
jgi:integrase/recombinase XerD